MEKLYIIDALAPFIDANNPPYNWSRAPLHDFEDINIYSAAITERFEHFIKAISKLGYNAVSIDDLPHMVSLDIYDDKLKAKLNDYKNLYITLFSIAKTYNIKVFVNFDIMYFNKNISDYVKKNKNSRTVELLNKSLQFLFDNYDVDGVITRFGECDGVDTQGLFKSKLVIKTPKQLNNYIRRILPTLEQNHKTWIFRTWSLGAYKVGDLMWNEKTFLKAFSGVESSNFIISMKYGNGDFFRNLELNPLFSLKKWNLIIELQTKREYDGFGDLPYYTGWDYQNYVSKLSGNNVGCLVWCMTGGWKNSNRITYFDKSSPWVELNTLSTIRLFQGKDADESIVEYFGDKQMIDFLRLYNDLSLRIMYPKYQPNRFFKKIKIPPLTWLFWGNVSINSLILSYQKYVVGEPIDVKKSDLIRLKDIGKRCNVPDIEFIYETLVVLSACRKFIDNNGNVAALRHKINHYASKYPSYLRFNVSETSKTKTKLRAAFYFSLRTKEKYRFIDKFLLNRIMLLIAVKIYMGINKNKLPEFVDSQAMPISTFLK